MQGTVRQNIILSVAMVVGCAVLWITSLSLRPESALWPRMLLVIIIICALVIAGEQLVRMRRSSRVVGSDPAQDAPAAYVHGPEAPEIGRNSGTDDIDDGHGHAREWLIAAASVVYVLGFVYVGPYTATFALLASLYVLLSQARTWKVALTGALLSAALTAMFYGLFTVLLSVTMPNSILI